MNDLVKLLSDLGAGLRLVDGIATALKDCVEAVLAVLRSASAHAG